MLSKRLKTARLRKKLTQQELANRLKTTKGTISNYENGHSTPSNEMLKELALILEVSTDYLLGVSDSLSHAGEIVSKEDQKKHFSTLLEAGHQNPNETYLFYLELAKRHLSPEYDHSMYLTYALNSALMSLEMRVDDLMFKGLEKEGIKQKKAFEFLLKSPSLKEKIANDLSSYLDYDFTKEEFFSSLINVIELRNMAIHARKDLSREKVKNAVSTIETALQVINKYTES